MKKLILICSLLLATLCSQALTCASGMSAVDLIQTGTITAIAPSLTDNNRVHSFLVPINVYTVPSTGFKIATSLSQYLIAQNRSQPGYDFSVVGFPLQGTSSAQIILFINNDLAWTRIIITYIITSRKDLFLGAFPILGYQFSSNSNKTYVYKYALANWLNPAAPVISLAQLAGFRTSTPQIQMLKINSATIDAFNGVLSVNITVDISAPLEMIVFSYVWWIQSANIKFSAFSPQAGSTAAYQYAGLGSVSSQGLVYNGLAFAGSGLVGSISCTGTNCPSTCISITNCITKNGVIANSTCFMCAANQTYQNFSCIAAVVCGINMRPLGSTCVCQDGFFYVNSTFCVKCPINGYWNAITNKCRCNFGYYSPDESICLVCPKGSTYNQVTLRCDCPAGFFWNIGGCITCGANQVFDSTRNQCVCASGYALSNSSVCVLVCPANSSVTATGCVCNFGFMNVSNNCVSCPPQSSYVQALRTCYCVSGFYMSNASCVACGPNSTPDSTQSKCICNNGFYNISGNCAACPANSAWNGTACDCTSGFRSVNGSCVPICGSNQVYNGLACICAETFVRFGNVCSCPLNSQLLNAKCICASGFTMTNGVCVRNVTTPTTPTVPTTPTTPTVPTTPITPQCPEKSAWNDTKCICIPGLNMIDGSCQTCPRNSEFDIKSQQCVCRPGFYGDSKNCSKCEKGCRTCWNGNQNGCLSCTAKFKLQKGSCVCRDPKKNKEGKQIC